MDLKGKKEAGGLVWFGCYRKTISGNLAHKLIHGYLNNLWFSLPLNVFHIPISPQRSCFQLATLGFPFWMMWCEKGSTCLCALFSSKASSAPQTQCFACTSNTEICKHWKAESRMQRKHFQHTPSHHHPSPPLPLPASGVPLRAEHIVWAAKAPINLLLAALPSVLTFWWIKVETKNRISYYCFLGMKCFLSLKFLSLQTFFSHSRRNWRSPPSGLFQLAQCIWAALAQGFQVKGQAPLK